MNSYAQQGINFDSLRYLQASFARIEGLIRDAVSRAQAAGHDPTDALRGLVISDGEVEDQLAKPSLAGLWPDSQFAGSLPEFSLEEDSDLPFLYLLSTFELTALDGYILLLCLAPELDRRYERLYGYLQDDVSQRHPTVNLMMNLLGNNVDQRFAVWERLQSSAPLQRHHLINCSPDPSRRDVTFLMYRLKVDHRIVAYLLGDDAPDQHLQDAVRLATTDGLISVSESAIQPIRNALPESPMIFMRGAPGMGQVETAKALCGEFRMPLVVVDLARVAGLDIPFTLAWRLALREAYLADSAVLLDRWESCLDDNRQPASEFWSALVAYRKPVFLCGGDDWEPLDIYRKRRLLRVQFTIPPHSARYETWQYFADHENIRVEDAVIDSLASKFRFGRSQIARAVHTAVDLADSQDEVVSVAHLYAGAQAHAGLRLGHMAKRIMPRYEWTDLILPAEQLAQLREMTTWARFAHVVHEEWGFGKKVAKVQGVSGLFAGESGTGKTMAAEVIARNLGLVLYKIDLSAVVSKYIGETEKNLSVIFHEARSGNAILFFDEADAIFGKRSEVKDARDRYANIEIAYLLQEIEDYDGIAILATNLRQNLDEAFTRRLDFLIDFPFPESEYRRRIWSTHFPPEAPLAPDIDLDTIAERYHLAGGNIRNVALSAAYLAADDGGVITMAHVRHAIRREHQKMGRLLDDL